jgi:hypothetical protein
LATGKKGWRFAGLAPSQKGGQDEEIDRSDGFWIGVGPGLPGVSTGDDEHSWPAADFGWLLRYLQLQLLAELQSDLHVRKNAGLCLRLMPPVLSGKGTALVLVSAPARLLSLLELQRVLPARLGLFRQRPRLPRLRLLDKLQLARRLYLGHLRLQRLQQPHRLLRFQVTHASNWAHSLVVPYACPGGRL